MSLGMAEKTGLLSEKDWPPGKIQYCYADIHTYLLADYYDLFQDLLVSTERPYLVILCNVQWTGAQHCLAQTFKTLRP